MRSGKKSLEEGLRFLDALANQLLNDPEHPEKQQLETFGIMVPRTACAADLTPAEVERVKTHVTQHHALQAAPILYAKAVLESLKREYDRAELVPAEKFENDPPKRGLYCSYVLGSDKCKGCGLERPSDQNQVRFCIDPSDTTDRCPVCKRDVTDWNTCVCGKWIRPRGA